MCRFPEQTEPMERYFRKGQWLIYWERADKECTVSKYLGSDHCRRNSRCLGGRVWWNRHRSSRLALERKCLLLCTQGFTVQLEVEGQISHSWHTTETLTMVSEFMCDSWCLFMLWAGKERGVAEIVRGASRPRTDCDRGNIAKLTLREWVWSYAESRIVHPSSNICQVDIYYLLTYKSRGES